MIQQQPQNHSKYGSHYERKGERTTQRIAGVVGRKSWKWIILNLAWTAGPVTFLALQFGHVLGFGDTAPFRNFIYFAGYTIVAGVFAVIASIIHDAFYKPKIEAAQKRLLNVIDLSFLLKQTLRDRILQNLDPNERRIMAAYYVLQGASATPSAIGTAVMDLTGSPAITRAARNVEVFAEQGMMSRVDMIREEIEEELNSVKDTLEPLAPQAYELLEERLSGANKGLTKGRERVEGFIDRVLDAGEHTNHTLMTLHDAMDMVVLNLELLSGRKVAVLDVRLKGDAQLEDAQESLDEARHHYRMALRKRNSLIRLLADTLYDETEIDMLLDATDSTSYILEKIEEAIKSLSAEDAKAHRLPYIAILQASKTLQQRYDKLLKTEKNYAKIWAAHGKRLTLAVQSADLKRTGFYIQERAISLSDKQKMRLVDFMYKRMSADLIYLSDKGLKEITMDMANELDDLIDMSQPEEQLAIESSNATNFGYITNNLSATTKAGWASLGVETMHQNRQKASHRLARNLVNYYRVPLTDSIIELMNEQFGADEEYLHQLNEEAKHIDTPWKAMVPSVPLKIKPWDALVPNRRK